MYYIISLKHTQRKDGYITLWRPDNRGYCYAKEDAGIYKEIEEGYHNCEGDSLPINKVKRCIPNRKQVWDALGLKMTKQGLRIKEKQNEKL